VGKYLGAEGRRLWHLTTKPKDQDARYWSFEDVVWSKNSISLKTRDVGGLASMGEPARRYKVISL
jgi:hypothetical protein